MRIFLVCIMACVYFYHLGYNVASSVESLQHDLCYDTKTHEAWIARKGNDMRCFMEHREYPHRVKGSYLDNSN